MLLLAITFLLIFIVIWSIRTPKVYVIKSKGNVQSVNKNYVMSPYTGEITDITIEEGMYVEKGEFLFSVKSAELGIQSEQLKGQKQIYEKQILQYEKLVQSVKDGKNYFDPSNTDDNLYYSQYELYKSQIAQQQVDVGTYKSYGYTDEQIESELIKSQNKITEIYHTTIKTAEDTILQCEIQLNSIQAQLNALENGQDFYKITANETGRIHMLTDYKDGMVVQAASPVASIASEQDEYIVQAYVSPAEAVRLKLGDSVDIAVAGLVQNIYGTITGTVVKMDSDLSTSQSNDGNTASYFKIEIKPDEKYLVSKDGDKVNISNGMEVEARIQYDKVTYFEYVLEALGVLTR
jgi:multidrug resistance efflux pump